jgi:hypothetical protein
MHRRHDCGKHTHVDEQRHVVAWEVVGVHKLLRGVEDGLVLSHKQRHERLVIANVHVYDSDDAAARVLPLPLRSRLCLLHGSNTATVNRGRRRRVKTRGRESER